MFVLQLEKFQSTKDPHSIKELTIKRAEKRLFHFRSPKQGPDRWAIVCDTKTHLGQKTITFRSAVQVTPPYMNYFLLIYPPPIPSNENIDYTADSWVVSCRNVVFRTSPTVFPSFARTTS